MSPVMTGRQESFIRTLATQRDVTALDADNYATLVSVLTGNGVTGVAASNLIGAMLKCPRVTPDNAPDDNRPSEAGYYLHNDEVFRVRAAKGSGNLYAQKMEIDLFAKRGKWNYERGLINRLSGAVRLSVEEAARLGHHHGVCVICGAELTDPASVERGIGPVCAKRL